MYYGAVSADTGIFPSNFYIATCMVCKSTGILCKWQEDFDGQVERKSQVMEYRTGYKVVCLDGGWLKSWAAPGRGRCIYTKDVPVKRPPRCGPLAVFNTLQSAKNFLNCSAGEIWRVDYRPSRNKSLWVMLEDGCCERCVRQELPTGTRLANEVILRERIL